MNLQRAAFIGVSAAAVWSSLAVASGEASGELSVCASPPDAVVVFGSSFNTDGSPTPKLAARLETALRLGRQYSRATLVVSGGTSQQGALAEGPAMKRWLVGRGLAAERVLVEPAARHTGENADLVVPLLEGIGARRVAAVTCRAHLPRAMFHLRWSLAARGMAGVRLEGAGAGPRPELRERAKEAVKLVRDAGFRVGAPIKRGLRRASRWLGSRLGARQRRSSAAPTRAKAGSR